jgi:hypothetical protein
MEKTKRIYTIETALSDSISVIKEEFGHKAEAKSLNL